MSEGEGLDGGDSRELSRIDDRIGPSAVYPVDLQDVSPMEDLWSRIRSHANGASYSKRFLTENPELSLAITIALNAAIERESKIVLHNQSRVFAEVLGRAYDGFRAYLNTSLAPSHWNGPLAPAPPRIEMAQPVSDEEAQSGETAPGTDAVATDSFAPQLWQKLTAMALTPKIFLGIALAVLAFATGYSQLQILNYKASIESFKSAAAGAGESKKNLDELILTLKTKTTSLETRLANEEKRRIESEAEFLKSTKKSASLSVENKALNSKIKDLEGKFAKERGSVEEQVATAEKSQLEAEEKLKASDKKRAAMETQLAVLQQQNKTLEGVYKKLDKDYEQSQKQIGLQVEAVRAAQAETRRLENNARLLLLAEQALNTSLNALPYGRNNAEQTVYNAVYKYRSDKKILNGN